MLRNFIATCFAIFPLLFVAPAAAQEQSVSPETNNPAPVLRQRAEEIAQVMLGERDAADVFGPQFLAEVSPDRFAQIVQQVTDQFGDLVGVERIEPAGPHSATLYLRFEKAIGSGPLTLDPTPPNKVAGLILASFAPIDDDLAKVTADLEALPGSISALFAPLDAGSTPVLALQSDNPLAIASTFKLYVLSALAQSIEAGERSWSDVITLDRKSFPSGRMHLWPEGSPVTLHTLATQMVTISDNTATDMLFHELGRRAVEAEMRESGHSSPQSMTPMLSTLELFALKGSPANREKYLAADEAGKRLILRDFEDDIGGNPDEITPPRFSQPTSIDTVEWFATTRDLAAVMARFISLSDPAAREILSVAPALPVSLVDDWQYVGYKGGSEPGVLNLTWLLQDAAGGWHILALSWNNTEAPLDHSRLELIAQRLIRLRP